MRCCPYSSSLWQALVLTILCCLPLLALASEPGSAVDLTSDSYESFLSGLPPSRTVLMEYYAHWYATLPCIFL